jgi:hydroxymethylbilane synthase
VARLITRAHADVTVEIIVIRTTGDRITAAPLAQIGGPGVFTREIEDALRAGTIDVAVHSLKDLPTRLAEGLALAAVLARADPRDVLVAPPGTRLGSLPAGARIGTSSPRRRAQVLACNPRVVTLDVRGNVPTRIAKLDRGEYDALILAHAGLSRLGLDTRIAEILEPEVIMPAPGQGAIAIEARNGDEEVLGLLDALDHQQTRLATDAERAVLSRLEAGCHAPVGALGTWDGDTICLRAVVAASDGSTIIRAQWRGAVHHPSEAHAAGFALADTLLSQGASAFVASPRPDQDGLAPTSHRKP